MKIIDFGKNKGKQLQDCEESYLKWLVTHEKVLAKRNRWASRDAAFILERRAQATTVETKGNTNWQEWHQSLRKSQVDVKIAKHLASMPVKVDLGLKGNLNTSRGFSLMK